MSQLQTSPRGWKRADLEQDQSWVHRLSEQEIHDLEAGLRHVLALNKKEFELSAADFPGDGSHRTAA
jgi:hypothetical protein